MARPLRIEYKDAIYHIMNRGRRRENIFFDDGDYYIFLSVLAEAVNLFRIKVYAYSLMSNHYHLLIGTPDGNISRAMRHINGVYTQKLNKKHKLEGALFKGRYKSILVEATCYFTECVRYIHRNPLNAGLEKFFGQYKWTSHYSFLYKKKREEWLQIEEALSYFSKYEKEAIEKYSVYVQHEVPEKFKKRLDGLNWPAVMGGNIFKETIKKMILGKDLSEVPSSEIKDSLPAETFEEALGVFLKHFKMTLSEYNKKQNEYNKVRAYTVKYCREVLKCKNVEIAEFLNVSVETVSRAYQQVKGSSEYAMVVNLRMC